MNVLDWRAATPGQLGALYDAERERWLRQLRWDTTQSWHEVELARTTWGLPGLIAVDDAGDVHGSAFFMLEGDRLDIGGIVSCSDAVTDALIDGIVSTARQERALLVRGLLLDGLPSLASALRAHGFDVEPHLYLMRRLTVGGGAAGTSHQPSHDASGAATRQPFGSWQEGDIAAAAHLLQRAYDERSGELFAPGGGRDAWQQYVRNLTTYLACGRVLPGISRVLYRDGTMQALALVTEIGPGTAHLAQLAVDPALRSQGIARDLLEQVCGRLAAEGHEALTLIVAGDNRAATSLYESLGFIRHAAFLAATLRLGG